MHILSVHSANFAARFVNAKECNAALQIRIITDESEKGDTVEHNDDTFLKKIESTLLSQVCSRRFLSLTQDGRHWTCLPVILHTTFRLIACGQSLIQKFAHSCRGVVTPLGTEHDHSSVCN